MTFLFENPSQTKSAPASAEAVKKMFFKVRIWLVNAAAVARSRQHLRNLDRSQLDDIDVSRHDALIEANRAYWDIPGGWPELTDHV